MVEMNIVWLLVLAVQLRLGAGYPEGRPDCPVVGQWIDHAGNRSVTVSTVQPNFLDYLKLQPDAKYLLHYQNNWDTHKGEVRSHHGNFLLAGVVPSVQQPEHLLYLVLACYRRELWVLAVPYLSGEYHSSAFFRMTPVVTRASDDAAPPPPPNDTDHKIVVNVSMWGGPEGPTDDTEAPQ